MKEGLLVKALFLLMMLLVGCGIKIERRVDPEETTSRNWHSIASPDPDYECWEYVRADIAHIATGPVCLPKNQCHDSIDDLLDWLGDYTLEF